MTDFTNAQPAQPAPTAPLRIIYMGTPDFAVESLRRLVEGGYNVVAVVTMPDKPVGRHHDTLQPSPVKQYALAHNLPVLQPEKLKDPDFLDRLRALRPDVGVVVAFRMLPEAVWAMPRLGTFNLHAALLPQYRGAAPINWAIINGDNETGITTFFLDHDIDTGRVISQVRVPIHDTDDAEAVHDRLMLLGGDLVCQTIDDLQAGTVTAIDQSELTTDKPLRPAPKIFKETCEIHWPGRDLDSHHNFVRGLSPYPAAWTTLPDGRVMKIFRTEREHCAHTDNIGAFRTDGRSYIKVAVTGGYLHLTDIQIAGKKRMPVADFLRGAKLTF